MKLLNSQLSFDKKRSFLNFNSPDPPETPRLTRSPSDKVIRTGITIKFKCRSTTVDSAISYIFQKDNIEIGEPSGGSFSIDSPTTGNSGNYSCLATIKGINSSLSKILTVTFIGELCICFSNFFVQINIFTYKSLLVANQPVGFILKVMPF